MSLKEEESFPVVFERLSGNTNRKRNTRYETCIDSALIYPDGVSFLS